MTRALLILAVVALPQLTAAQAVSPIDKVFERWRDDTPGCAVGVSRGGKKILEKGYGMASLENAVPITPATVFHAASLAKQVTAMAVMLLARDGKLSLDDDVRKFVPELPSYGRPITIRHLLTHTSGLRDYIEILILARGRFEEERITQADMMDAVVRQKALNSLPGTEYLYTNTGYALLAVTVGRVAGKSLRDFAAERIFAPLGMSHTSFRDDVTAIIPGSASGYDARGNGWRSSVPNYDAYGPTNLMTTVGDLLLWSENFRNPRVGDSSIVRQMTTSVLLPSGDSTNYGFGIALVRDRGARVQEHEGSDPGFRAYLGRYVDFDLDVAVLCNTRSANAVGGGHAVAQIYLDTLLDATQQFPATPVVLDTVSVKERAGVYFQPGRVEVVEVSWRDGSLYTARRGGRKLVPIGDNRFRVEGFPVVHTFGPDRNSGYIASSLLPGRSTVTFERKAPFTATKSSLTDYAGEYFSDEMNSTWRVEASDSTIRLATGTSEGITARPVFDDTFVSGQLVFEFVRSGRRITGLRVTHPRARRIGFVRVAGSGKRKGAASD